MEIQLENGEYLDLPPEGIQLGISHSNPMLSKQGSYSLPVLFPASDYNRRLLKDPERYDRANKHIRKWTAYVRHGSFQKKATLNVEESGDDIDAYLLMNESEMYEKMKETKLESAFNIIRQASEFLPDETFTDDMDRLIRYLEQIRIGNYTDDFCLFEIAADKESFTLDDLPDHAYDVFQFLNELAYRKVGGAIEHETYDTDALGHKYRIFRARYPHTVYLNGNLVDVPKGYGITPFLRLDFMLRRIFGYFGYLLAENPFDTDSNLNNIVILNNTADAIMLGIIDYAQLVPSVTIDEFLNNIRNAFGCEFFISPDNKGVEVKFWNDILSDPSVMNKDYTPYLTARPRTVLSDPKTVKLTFKRSFDTEVPYNTLEEFESKFGTLQPISELPYIPNDLNNIAPGYYLVRNICQIWQVYYDTDIQGNVKKLYSRPLFDYYKEENTEYDEHSCDLEFVPSMAGLRRKGFTLTEGDIQNYDTYTYFPSFNKVYPPALYFGERRHMNTVLEKSSSGTDTEVVKETAGDCPLGMLFFRTFYFQNANNIENPDDEMTGYGIAYRYDPNGAVTGALDLIPGGDSGLFNRFYSRLDNVLRNSFQQLKVTAKLPEEEITGFRMDRLVCIDNQPLLPEQIEYTVDDNGIEVNKIVFRTVKIYKDE